MNDPSKLPKFVISPAVRTARVTLARVDSREATTSYIGRAINPWQGISVSEVERNYSHNVTRQGDNRSFWKPSLGVQMQAHGRHAEHSSANL